MFYRLALPLLILVVLTGCAHQPDAQAYDVPGFFSGLWHGAVAPLALLGHLIDNSIRIYAFPNSGGWYDFGFLIGLGGGGIFGLGLLND